MPNSVRLDPETEALLNRLARQQGRTKSDIMREALQRLAEEEQTVESQLSLYERAADLIGIAQSGSGNLAQQHKQEFRDLLKNKHQNR